MDSDRQPTLDELRAKVAATPALSPWQGKYAAEPGTGPDGKTCRTCAHKRYTGQAKPSSHPKCGLTNYTSGDATTIKTSTPACRHYTEARDA